MAKKSMINREEKREQTVAKYAAKRAELKAIIASSKASDEERFDAMMKLQALPRNAIGHVLIKSPTQFKGYLNRPDINEHVQRGGWLHIGDIGYLDDEGLLHILGRAPDLIRRHGITTYPRYAEEALHDHPAVKEAAFVQVGDQAIMAVSLRRGWRARLGDATLADDMLAFLSQRVSAQDLPDGVHLLEELPRSPLGKVLRREVRQGLASQADLAAPEPA